MATKTVGPLATYPKGKGRVPKHCYTPPQRIQEVPGVDKRIGPYDDTYLGTKEQLIAMGLVQDGQFPGDPGMPRTHIVLWPHGTAASACIWPGVPGRLFVKREARGRFSASLKVDALEVARRKAQEAAERAQLQAIRKAEDRQCRAERRAGVALTEIVQELGVEAVFTLVDRLRRQGQPQRSREHLRLAWSAP